MVFNGAAWTAYQIVRNDVVNIKFAFSLQTFYQAPRSCSCHNFPRELLVSIVSYIHTTCHLLAPLSPSFMCVFALLSIYIPASSTSHRLMLQLRTVLLNCLITFYVWRSSELSNIHKNMDMAKKRNSTISRENYLCLHTLTKTRTHYMNLLSYRQLGTISIFRKMIMARILKKKNPSNYGTRTLSANSEPVKSNHQLNTHFLNKPHIHYQELDLTSFRFTVINCTVMCYL
jgi:hypothetical protein